MYGVSIWHWILVAMFIVVPLAYLGVGIAILARKKSDDPGVSGFGGWMIGIVILQLLLPVPFALRIRDLLEDYEEVSGTVHGPLSEGGKIGISALVLTIVLIAIIAMFRRSRRFPALYAIQWSVLVFLPAFEFLWEAWALDLEYRQLARFYDIGVGLGAALVLIVGSGTLWYLYSSRRSKNTFVR